MGDLRRFEPKSRRGSRRHESVIPRASMPSVACAFCDSEETEPVSIYGCHMMTAQYQCRSCRSVFDWVRAEPLGPDFDDR